MLFQQYDGALHEGEYRCYITNGVIKTAFSEAEPFRLRAWCEYSALSIEPIKALSLTMMLTWVYIVNLKTGKRAICVFAMMYATRFC